MTLCKIREKGSKFARRILVPFPFGKILEIPNVSAELGTWNRLPSECDRDIWPEWRVVWMHKGQRLDERLRAANDRRRLGSPNEDQKTVKLTSRNEDFESEGGLEDSRDFRLCNASILCGEGDSNRVPTNPNLRFAHPEGKWLTFRHRSIIEHMY